jgi:CheY-like chemotaxis protein
MRTQHKFPLIQTQGRVAFLDDVKEAAEVFALSIESKFQTETLSGVGEARFRIQRASDAIQEENHLLQKILKNESASSILREMAVWLKNRKSVIEVCFCDYDMPFSNGIDVFNSIRKCHVRRVILTGVATDAIAIHAFNDNSIDGFLKKNTSSKDKEIETIAGLGAIRPDFLNYDWSADPEFGDMLQTDSVANAMRAYLDTFDTVEYAVLARPLGIISKNKVGDIYWHHIETESTLTETISILSDSIDDQRLISRVASGEIGVCFDFDEIFSKDPDQITKIPMVEISDAPLIFVGALKIERDAI